MFQNRRWFSIPLILFVVCMALAPLVILKAQNKSIIVSVAVPEYMEQNFPADAFSAFEADHPGVKVQLIKTGNDATFFPPAAIDADQYFKGIETYAGKADVLYVTSYNMATEGTRGGYFLDLAPLAKSDTTLNSSDFQPGAWDAFRWDGGFWALPISLDVIILSYDPAAFDKAGVPYPNGKWTVDDLADAARKLAVKDSDGKITLPGILAYNEGPLFRSMAGEPFYDSNAALSTPQFDKPSLIHLLEVWSKLQAEGVTGNNFQGDYNAVPMRTDQSYSIARNTGITDKPRSGALLPGGKAGLTVDGFGVSGGTQNPELAYALVKFITSEPKIASRFFGLMPARKNLSTNDQGSDISTFRPTFTPENQAVIDEALKNALPPSEYRFADYINKALGDMSEKKVEAKVALQQAEANAKAVLETASKKHGTNVVVVATPIPTPVLNQGEVSIQFHLVAFISPLPNREKWDQVIKDFISSDPQVRQVVLDTGFGSGNLSDFMEKFDCTVFPSNILTSPFTTSAQLLNLDPLMSADASFDKSDMIGNTLAQFKQNNQILAMPLYIQPQVLRYNAAAFAKAGIPTPANNWRIDAFNDALKALKVNPKDPAPFVPREYGGTYLQMLMAAYGGLPLDNRTSPTTVNFTDPATVDAIRQVLDLAKNGYIDYKKLATNGGGMMGGPATDPIYTTSLSMLNYYGNGMPSSDTASGDPYKHIAYPRGTQYTPLSYSVGAGYISAKASNPEACYRWLMTLSKHPELFWSMPARRSMIDSPGVMAQGADLVDFYKAFDAALQEPTAINITDSASSVGDYILSYFLYRVFDHYVLDGADLDSELKQAETFAKSYQECVANIPPSTASTQQEMSDYFKQFIDCAIKIDPSLKPILAPN